MIGGIKDEPTRGGHGTKRVLLFTAVLGATHTRVHSVFSSRSPLHSPAISISNVSAALSRHDGRKCPASISQLPITLPSLQPARGPHQTSAVTPPGCLALAGSLAMHASAPAPALKRDSGLTSPSTTEKQLSMIGVGQFQDATCTPSALRLLATLALLT